MNRPERDVSELVYVDFEGQLLFADQTAAIEKRLRDAGIFDKAHARAAEYLDGMVALPPADDCSGRVYREVDPDGKEMGGGIQLDVIQFGDAGLARYAIRVPAYTLDEDRVRPAGGQFDNYPDAEMVAMEVEGLSKLADEAGFSLSPDLTYIDDADVEGLVVVPCPAIDLA
jgi:hypothetical protein